jgi:hypothetical protein
VIEDFGGGIWCMTMRSLPFLVAGLVGAFLSGVAMWQDSATWAGATFLLTCALLCLAVVGLVCRGRDERAWWLGVCLFGWGYWMLAFGGIPHLQGLLPTTGLLERFGFMLGFPANYFERTELEILRVPFLQAGHSFLTLMVAVLGGMLSRVCFGISAGFFENWCREPWPLTDPARSFSSGAAILGSAAFGLIVAVTFLGSRFSPEFRAGAIYLLTRSVVGLACLGAILTRGRAREICLSACFMGGGYLFMVFDRSDDVCGSDLRTTQFLKAVRLRSPWAARALSGDSVSVTAANARILNALQRPISMRFRDDTPFEKVLQYIKWASRGPDGMGIPIYVDVIALQKRGLPTAESTVRSIDSEGVPLKTSLRLCLSQLDLQYEVRNGLLRITTMDESLPIHANPFMIVGQCVLALVATVVGGAMAALALSRRSRAVIGHQRIGLT